jgi:hypothetical protein
MRKRTFEPRELTFITPPCQRSKSDRRIEDAERQKKADGAAISTGNPAVLSPRPEALRPDLAIGLPFSVSDRLRLFEDGPLLSVDDRP